MMEFLSLKSEAFGLDISDFVFKAAKLKKRGSHLSLVSWCEIEIKPGLVEEGEIKDENALARALLEGLRRVHGEKLKTGNVIASLPEKKSFLQVIQMPKMKEEELKAALPFEAENYIPMALDEVYLDFQPVTPLFDNLDHQDILLVASPRKIVDAYVSCIKKAGLLPQALEIEPQSIARALIENEVSPSPVVLVDFGRSATSIVIHSGRALRFTSTVQVSSSQITQAISLALKITSQEADALKIKYGLRAGGRKEEKSGPKSRKDESQARQINEIILPIISDLASQIKKCLNFYQTHSSHEHITPPGKSEAKKTEKIILCGGGANLKGLTEYLSSYLNLPVKIGNPWVNILPENIKEVPKLAFKDSLGYSAAIGLALRGIKEQIV